MTESKPIKLEQDIPAGSASPLRIAHHRVEVRGIRMHVARAGSGPPLVLLHGWPEFWATCEPLMARLADRFDLLAPDLRGFGETGRDPAAPPDPTADADAHAADLLALLDALALGRVGLVGHDVGAGVMQAFARRHPQRLSGLFFFNCPTPAIGARWAAVDHLNETWYQFFHRQPWAAALAGSSRETCAASVGHLLRHRGADPRTFEGVPERGADYLLRPGNPQGGIDRYLASAPARRQAIAGTAPALPPIEAPTRASWGADDPILRAERMDLLGDTFRDTAASRAEGLGRFVHYEAPDRAAAAVARFFLERAG